MEPVKNTVVGICSREQADRMNGYFDHPYPTFIPMSSPVAFSRLRFGFFVWSALAYSSMSLAQEEEERSLMDMINAMERSVPPEAVPGATMDLSNDIFSMRQLEFETGKHALTPVHMEYLDSIAGHLLRAPSLIVYVQGHTDNVGNSITNQSLSQMRAKEVRAYLVKKGYPEENIESEGFGETRPLPQAKDNATDEERRLNRRVELLVLHDMEIKRGATAEKDEPKPAENGDFEIHTKDGRTIRSKDVVISEDGKEVSYYDPNDKAMKRLRAVDLDRVITPEGEAVRLAEVSTEIAKENTKRIAEDEILQQKYEAAIKAADEAYATGNYDEAERRYREARSYRPRDPYAKERLAVIVGKRGGAAVAPPPAAPAEEKPKTFWGKMKGRFEESFVFVGFGMQTLFEPNGFEIRDDYGITRIDHNAGDRVFPLAFSGLAGYEWENNRSQRSLYLRLMYEFIIMSHQVHKGSFGFGYAFNDRFRAGVDVFLGSGSRKLRTREIEYGSWLINGETFGPGEVEVSYRQFFVGLAPNASMGFFISPKVFGRVCAGFNIHPPNAPSYSVKLKGTDPDGGEVSTRVYSADDANYYYDSDDQVYPDRARLVDLFGPFVNFQFVFQ